MGKGKGELMRALLCGCGRRLVAADENGLCEKVSYHLKTEHPVMDIDQAQVRQIVATHSYCYEYAEVYAGAAEPDEEFGLEPY